MNIFVQLATAGALAASAASAATIDVTFADNPTDLAGEITCASCEALLFSGGATIPYSFSDTDGTAFAVGPGTNNPAGELAFIQTFTGQTFTSYQKNETVSDGTQYSIDALYAVLKFGKYRALITNTGTSDLTFTWDGGKGTGLSHFTWVGENPGGGAGGGFVVPLPASLPLMLAGFGAFGFLSRRKD